MVPAGRRSGQAPPHRRCPLLGRAVRLPGRTAGSRRTRVPRTAGSGAGLRRWGPRAGRDGPPGPDCPTAPLPAGHHAARGPRRPGLVIACHPRSRCEAGAPARTVRTLLSSRTPCSAHGVRSPFDGGGQPRSACSSVKMFASERGTGRTSAPTENARPTACPGVGYGSWPTTSTRTSAIGRAKARSTASGAGSHVAAGCGLGAQGVADPAQRRLDGGQSLGPVRGHDLVERLSRHTGRVATPGLAARAWPAATRGMTRV